MENIKSKKVLWLFVDKKKKKGGGGGGSGFDSNCFKIHYPEKKKRKES